MVEKIKWKRLILLAAVIWIVQATYTALSTGLVNQYSGGQVRWAAIAIYSYSAAITWLLLTPLAYFFLIKIERKSPGKWTVLGIQAVLSVLFSSIQRLMNIGMSYNLIKWTEAVDLSLLKLSNFFGVNFWYHVGNGIITYGIIVAILYGFQLYHVNQESRVKEAQLEGRYAKSRLQNLKHQLQPHFLFNSLQSISTLIHKDAQEADAGLTDLSELLRYNLRYMDQETVWLGEEILFLQKYLDIQKRRFAGKISLDVDCSDDVLDAIVPPFLIQPIIENSIKHVLQSTGKSVMIYLKIWKIGGRLMIQIDDDGPQCEESHHQKDDGKGTGLNNLEQRLELLYGPEMTFQYGHKHRGFRTLIGIPFQQNE